MYRAICLLCLALPVQAADFVITSYGLSGSNFSLSFPSAAGRIYGVERAQILGQAWALRTTYCGTGSPITFTEALGSGAAFYRVSEAPSPPLRLSPASPTLTSGAVSLPDATIGQSYALDISACPSGTAPFSLQVSGAPPAGLALTTTADSVQVRGSAAAAGRTQFEVTVRDALNATVTKTYDLRAINPPPAIVTESVSLKAGSAANIVLSASGGTGSLAWSVASGSLPDGVGLSGEGVLSGTPSATAAELNETGLHSAVLRVRDQHTDRVTGIPTPRLATRSFTSTVRLSWNLNLFAQRVNGPSFTARCYACHGAGFPPDVVSGNAADVIGVSSDPTFLCPDRVYITPRDPEQSLIYKKLTAPPCGDRMPQFGPYLNQTESNRLLRWIVELQPGELD
jgi:hypothetical protein